MGQDLVRWYGYARAWPARGTLPRAADDLSQTHKVFSIRRTVDRLPSAHSADGVRGVLGRGGGGGEGVGVVVASRQWRRTVGHLDPHTHQRDDRAATDVAGGHQPPAVDNSCSGGFDQALERQQLQAEVVYSARDENRWESDARSVRGVHTFRDGPASALTCVAPPP